MNTVNSLLDKALLIRHSEHIADPMNTILVSGRRSKVNSLIKDSIKMVDNIKSLLEKLAEELKNNK